MNSEQVKMEKEKNYQHDKIMGIKRKYLKVCPLSSNTCRVDCLCFENSSKINYNDVTINFKCKHFLINPSRHGFIKKEEYSDLILEEV